VTGTFALTCFADTLVSFLRWGRLTLPFGEVARRADARTDRLAFFPDIADLSFDALWGRVIAGPH
jgi:hypothetical protein